MRLLVTGGAGFIGSNFVHYTVDQRPQFAVPVLDALPTPGTRRTWCHRPRRSTSSKGTSAMRRSSTPWSPGPTSSSLSPPSRITTTPCGTPGRSSTTNVVGTYTLLEAVRRHGRRYHHISTDEVFGDLALDDTRKFDENTPYNPSSPYSATKAGSDHLVRAWSRSSSVQATITNCANNYGPYQHVEKMIPRQITNVLIGRMPRLYGAGVNIREWTHVDDHNAAVHLVLEKGRIGETYLIGSGDERSNREVFELILDLTGKPRDWYDSVADRAGHDLRYSNDSTKIRAELGWEPRYTDFRDGLAATVEWYRSNQSWWEPVKSAIEAAYATKGQ